jgi:hypothetical protein
LTTAGDQPCGILRPTFSGRPSSARGRRAGPPCAQPPCGRRARRGRDQRVRQVPSGPEPGAHPVGARAKEPIHGAHHARATPRPGASTASRGRGHLGNIQRAGGRTPSPRATSGRRRCAPEPSAGAMP